jgi:hypothetical protein
MTRAPGTWLVIATVMAAGCAAEMRAKRPQPMTPLAEVQGGAEIAIRRGPDMGLSLKVKPPYAVGPFSSMTIRKGRISGVHCGGGFAVTATPERISGHGPGGGTVEMEVWGDASEVNAEGLWNGAYGKLEATPERLRVSLAMAPTVVRAGRVHHARYRTYTFRRGADGLFTGDFAGRPTLYETRPGASLVISDRVHAYLTREELLAILLTLFAGAPGDRAFEAFGCGARG